MTQAMRHGHRWLRNAGQCWSCAAIGGLVGVIGAIVLLGILLASGWIASRGIALDQPACAWDEAAGRYRASIVVSNTEAVGKAVRVRLLAHFRPPAGSRWPSESLQQLYADRSEFASVAVGPMASAEAATDFEMPGIDGFACRVEAMMDRQDRFGSDS